LYCIGIDVGGTNLKAGLVDEQGTLLAVERRPLVFRGKVCLVETLAELSAAVMRTGNVSAKDVAGVGVGLPGAVSGGEVLYTANIPMKNLPLEQMFRRHLDLPVLLGNDADCAAVGEFFQGAGRSCRELAVITLGTGIGCGLILNGKLRGGSATSEAGHMAIYRDGLLCSCGRRGCWEQYASATALIRQTREAMAEHPESMLHRFGKDGIEGRTVFQAAQAGDKTALTVCRQYVENLAAGVINLVNILRPEILAIGGGVAAAPEQLLLEPLRTLVAAECYGRHDGIITRIVRAELGNDAGIVGAALLHRVI